MLPTSSIALALALQFCAIGDPHHSFLDRECPAALSDDQLASATGGMIVVTGPRVLHRIAEMQARDQMRVTGNLADVAMDEWWFTEGLDYMVEGARAAKALSQSTGPQSAGPQTAGVMLSADQGLTSFVATPSGLNLDFHAVQGTATISAEIRLGHIQS